MCFFKKLSWFFLLISSLDIVGAHQETTVHREANVVLLTKFLFERATQFNLKFLT